jgi:hypothetical protein
VSVALTSARAVVIDIVFVALVVFRIDQSHTQ